MAEGKDLEGLAAMLVDKGYFPESYAGAPGVEGMPQVLSTTQEGKRPYQIIRDEQVGGDVRFDVAGLPAGAYIISMQLVGDRTFAHRVTIR